MPLVPANKGLYFVRNKVQGTRYKERVARNGSWCRSGNEREPQGAAMSRPGRTVLIMGLGLHGGGAAAANYFASRGDRVVVTDLKTAGELAAGIAKLRDRERMQLVLGRHRYRDFRRADLVIKNPGVPRTSPFLRYARDRGVPVDTDVGLFLDRARSVNARVIGVTGTKGKSTTASLLYHMIRREHGDALLGGNITISVLELMDRLTPGCPVMLELSSFQLGDIDSRRYSPPAALVTNFMDDHLDRYPGAREYFRDKTVIFRYQGPGDRLVVNRENEVYGLVSRSGGRITDTFGIEEPAEGEGTFLRQGTVCRRGPEGVERIMDARDILLPGRHNLYNLLAAAAVARCEGVPPRAVAEAARGFRGLAHRMEHVGSVGGVRVYNDSAATTPDAAMAALDAVEGEITLIAGGSDKNLPLERLARAVERRVRLLVLLEGSGTAKLLEAGIGIPYELFDNLEDAARRAVAGTPPGGTVLLSPGFASFGMFKNEFDRGDRFREIVRELERDNQGQRRTV
jgi:UDP-N-acetylmuramoylalanine--D-glutamate ligase